MRINIFNSHEDGICHVHFTRCGFALGHDHGAFTGTFHGVLLWTLIDKSAPIDATGKNTFLRHTFLVSSSGDQYAAAVSEGEIHPKLENKLVILAIDENGAPLATPMLIVPGDAHASRAVKDVTSVTVQ